MSYFDFQFYTKLIFDLEIENQKKQAEANCT